MKCKHVFNKISKFNSCNIYTALIYQVFLHSKYSITFGENIKIFLTFPYQLMIIETEGPGDLQGQT